MTHLGRFCASTGVALTLLLTVMAVWPEAHGWLHPDANHVGHDCAITLFAHGVAAPVAPAALSLVVWRLVRALVFAPVEVELSSPDYRLLPSRAPPGR